MSGAGREYIEVALTQPLTTNIPYCVRFRYAFGDSSTAICDGLAVHFSSDSLMQITGGFTLVPVIPQLALPDSVLTIDTTNWILFVDTFLAQGGEQYLTIGNFVPTDSIYWEWIREDWLNTPRCYLFLDAVEVFECDPLSVYNRFSTKPFFILFPNPTSSNTTCEIQTSSENVSLVVTDVTGRKLFEIETQNGLVELPTSQLSNGVYFVHCKSNGQLLHSHKLLVQR